MAGPISGKVMRVAPRCSSTPAPVRAVTCPGSICSNAATGQPSNCTRCPLCLRIPLLMRTFGFIGAKTRPRNEIEIPGARMARVNQSLKRRLDDDVEEVFSRACATNDLESAADLLLLLEKWHARRSASYG